MLYFLLVVSELILLFFFSKKLINNLARLIFRITSNYKVVVKILAVIFLPGTIIHELAHLLLAGAMFVPVGEINVLPEIEEKGVKLGSVQIGKSDLLRRILIGVAPVLLGMLVILAILLLIPLGKSNTPLWQSVLSLYLIFEISNTMFSSKKDLEGAIAFLVMVFTVSLIIFVITYFINPSLIFNSWAYFNTLNLQPLESFFKSISLYLAIPLILDLAVIFLTTLLARK